MSNRSPQIPAKQLKAQFDNIKDILATNLSDNRGLENIITALQHHISQLPHVGTALPKTWVKVRKQLEQDHRYHIELKEYFEICQKNGFEKEKDKLQLSGYLHDLGVCLHFQDDDLLCKTLILKPTWATDGVYKVLDNPQVIANFGRFNKDDLGNIWQDKKYTAMRGELLALMLNFKLCFEIPNQAKHYIAPQLLDNNAPDYRWKSADNLLLRYQYDFMPKGLLSQFIVAMHEHIADNYNLLWKSGVVLKKEQTRAEVIEYYGKREIHIRVSGQQKKELLNIVSYELDKINNSYERLKEKCKKLIPCNCSNCLPLATPHFYDYGKLKERVAHNKYTIECGNPPYVDVEILKLIGDKNFQSLENMGELATGNFQHHYENCTFNNNDIGKNEENIMQNGDINISSHIGGNVTGSSVIVGNHNTQNDEKISKDDFLKLLQTCQQELINSGLPEEIIEVMAGDIETVNQQMQKDKPNEFIAKNKINSVNDLLENEKENILDVEILGNIGSLASILSLALGFF